MSVVGALAENQTGFGPEAGFHDSQEDLSDSGPWSCRSVWQVLLIFGRSDFFVILL